MSARSSRRPARAARRARAGCRPAPAPGGRRPARRGCSTRPGAGARAAAELGRDQAADQRADAPQAEQRAGRARDAEVLGGRGHGHLDRAEHEPDRQQHAGQGPHAGRAHRAVGLVARLRPPAARDAGARERERRDRQHRAGRGRAPRRWRPACPATAPAAARTPRSVRRRRVGGEGAAHRLLVGHDRREQRRAGTRRRAASRRRRSAPARPGPPAARPPAAPTSPPARPRRRPPTATSTSVCPRRSTSRPSSGPPAPCASANAPETSPAAAYEPVASSVWTSRPMPSMAIGSRATSDTANSRAAPGVEVRAFMPHRRRPDQKLIATRGSGAGAARWRPR